MDDVTTDNADMLLALMNLVEMMEKGVKNAEEILAADYSSMTLELWDKVRENEDLLLNLCRVLVQQMPDVAKISTNSALMAHMQAVTTAD